MFKDGNTWHYTTLCQLLGYQFKNKRLLIQALTRRSSIQEGVQDSTLKDFQRLEFLGDRVIDIVISDYLFETNPEWNEGSLSTEKSRLVNNNGPLLAVANTLKLSEYLITGLGERYLVASNHEKILSDHVESLFGAIFLDCGKDYKTIRRLIIKHWNSAGLIKITNQMYHPTDSTLEVKQPSSAEIAKILEKYGTSFDSVVKVDQFGHDQLDEALLNLVEFCQGEEQESDLRTLLQAGANPNSVKKLHEEYWIGDESCIGDQYTRSALQIAVTNENPSLVAIGLLLKYGADPNWNKTTHTKDTGPLYMYSLQDLAKCKSIVTETKLTALHLIAKRNYCGQEDYALAYEVVQLLLNNNANPLKTDHLGNTPYTIRVNYIERLNREYRQHYSSISRELLCGEISEQENKLITKLLKEATYGPTKPLDVEQIHRDMLIEISGVFDVMKL